MALFGRDWMPTTIQGRIDMGRTWVEKLKVKAAAWGIPSNTVTELEEFVESAEEMQAQAVSPNAAPAKDRVFLAISTSNKEYLTRSSQRNGAHGEKYNLDSSVSSVQAVLRTARVPRESLQDHWGRVAPDTENV